MLDQDQLQAASWPIRSLAEVEGALTGPGQPFEIESLDIRGRQTRVWKNAPASFRDLVLMAREHDAATFMVFEEERVSYRAFYRATARLAHWLHEQGVKKGDRVAVAMANLPEWPVSVFAASVLGAIIVPLNAWWSGRELHYGLLDSGARVLIADAERYHRIAEFAGDLPDLEIRLVSRQEEGAGGTALEGLIGVSAGWADLDDASLPEADLAPDDLATIFYTSGTTGAPKGALGTYRSALTNPVSTLYSLARTALRKGEEPEDPQPRKTLMSIPLFHVTAFNASLLGTIMSGSMLVLMKRWDVLEAYRLIEKEGVNGAGGVPTIVWQLLEHPARTQFDLSSLDTIGYGGAPASGELARRVVSELKAVPNTGWGMTETSAALTHHAGEDYLNRPESCGPVLPVAQIRVMDIEGRSEVASGEVGELWVTGPQVVVGYWNKPEATAQSFVDGWVRTGDLARLDEEGFCYIVDRAKDVIIRGGENIYSVEVEGILLEHPAVLDAAVVGVPDRILGEVPAAVVMLVPGRSAQEEELKQWVRSHLAAFKTPVSLRFMPGGLPRNASGKLLKLEIRKMFIDPAT